MAATVATGIFPAYKADGPRGAGMRLPVPLLGDIGLPPGRATGAVAGDGGACMSDRKVPTGALTPSELMLHEVIDAALDGMVVRLPERQQ